MLHEKPEIAANVLLEHPAAVRRAADVHELRAGGEEHLPSCLCEAVTPVGLLAEEEEVLVEQSDLVDRSAADEHARAHHGIGFDGARMVEVRGIERVQRARARREL